MTQNPDVGTGTPISLAGLRAGADVGGYRLLRRLGAGGMGVVWEVADGEGSHVAMKILHPQIAADPMARRRLDREASVLARVKDSRVARILDIETGDGADGSGVTFVITELVDGPTLQHEVDYEGAYDLSTDARDLSDLAHGLVDSLSAVHAAGVIHRDLKPSNVMLGAQGPVLIDFGIAQVADDVRLTQTGQVTGTPGFIPPEMLDGQEPTPGVDWYACAGVLLFAVTGRAPFGSGPWQAVFRRVYAGTPELGALEEDCPALAQAFTAALATEADDRLSVEDLLRVLDDVADGGTGQEVVDELLGNDGGASEADTATGTFAANYGIMTPPQSVGTGPRPGAPNGPGAPGGVGVPGGVGAPSGGGYGGYSGYSGYNNGYRTPSTPSSGGYGTRPGAPSAGMGPPPGAYGYLGASGPAAPTPTPPSPSTSMSGAVGAPPSFRPDGGQQSGPMTPSTGVRPTGVPAAYAPGSNTGVRPAQPSSARPAPLPAPGPVPSPTPAPISPPAQPAQPAQQAPAQPTGPQPTGAHPTGARPTGAQPAGAQPTGVQPAVSTETSDSLPSWAREPRRHPVVILAGFAFLAALSFAMPFWVVILFVVILVVAGTVGRAEDARRWRRLEAGRVSAGDSPRMWAGVPWYLLRSLVANIFAAIPGLLVFGVAYYVLNRLVFAEAETYYAVRMTWGVPVTLSLFVGWMVPWGAPTRRGGARMVEAAMGSESGPVIGGAVLLAAAAGLMILLVLGALPTTAGPFFYES